MKQKTNRWLLLLQQIFLAWCMHHQTCSFLNTVSSSAIIRMSWPPRCPTSGAKLEATPTRSHNHWHQTMEEKPEIKKNYGGETVKYTVRENLRALQSFIYSNVHIMWVILEKTSMSCENYIYAFLYKLRRIWHMNDIDICIYIQKKKKHTLDPLYHYYVARVTCI